jgi:hypothetical protein
MAEQQEPLRLKRRKKSFVRNYEFLLCWDRIFNSETSPFDDSCVGQMPLVKFIFVTPKTFQFSCYWLVPFAPIVKTLLQMHAPEGAALTEYSCMFWDFASVGGMLDFEEFLQRETNDERFNSIVSKNILSLTGKPKVFQLPPNLALSLPFMEKITALLRRLFWIHEISPSSHSTDSQLPILVFIGTPHVPSIEPDLEW